MESSVGKETETKDEGLELARQQFEEYADATISIRNLAEKCRDYKDGNQWTEAERNTLKKRKQPCITDNKVQDKVSTLMGMERQQRTDPKAFPRNPDDEESAEVATDTLRFIADENVYQTKVRKPCTDNLIVEGLCAGQVVVEKNKGRKPKISMEHIRWDRVYYDIQSLDDDFSDCSYKGYFRWMDYDAAQREFPDRKEALDASNASGSSVQGPNRTHDDKPRYFMTVRNRKRVQVFKHFAIIDGVWHEGVWCHGGWLEPMAPCAYKDEHGEPHCCLELQAVYRDSEGMPYGLVPRWLDLQDEHNKRRSKMLHLLNAKRIVTQKGQVQDVGKVREEIHKPDGVVEVAGSIQEFRVEDNLNEAQGQWQLLQQTDQALTQTGPNAALQGLSGSISGRAKQLDQQSGQLLVSPLYDALDAFELRLYRHAWCRARQYWPDEMWIRVTDDEKNLKFVKVNEPMTRGMQMAEQLKRQQMPQEQKMAMLAQIDQDPMRDVPALDAQGMPMKRNNLAQMDVDFIIDRAPDTVNIQQEQFEVLATLAEKRPEVPFEIIVQASQLRSSVKKQITDAIKGADDPQAEQMAKMQEQIQQLQAAMMEAKVRRENAAAAKDEQATVESKIDGAVKVATMLQAQAQPPEAQVSVN